MRHSEREGDASQPTERDAKAVPPVDRGAVARSCCADGLLRQTKCAVAQRVGLGQVEGTLERVL